MPTFRINKIEIKTRRCRKSDYPFVFNLVKKTLFPYVAKYHKPSKKMFDERFAKDYKKRVILLHGKKMIGFYQITPKRNVLNVTGNFLIPSYQKKGIGKYIMKYFETLPFKKIRLHVWDNNPAYRFYKRLGYKTISKNNHKYIMEKNKKIIF